MSWKSWGRLKTISRIDDSEGYRGATVDAIFTRLFRSYSAEGLENEIELSRTIDFEVGDEREMEGMDDRGLLQNFNYINHSKCVIKNTFRAVYVKNVLTG